jgi:curli biogenesis system outer membrane secretion channel CsgG
MRTTTATIALAATLFLATGLSAQEKSVPIKVKTIPERSWSQYKKIIIAEFEGPDGTITNRSRDISDYVGQTFTKAGEFKVYDRNNLPGILKEHKLQMSGVFDETTTLKAGKLIAADLIITGRVQMDDFAQDDGHVPVPLGGRVWALKTTKGQYVLAVRFTLLNGQTGETLDQFVESIKVDGKSKIGHSDQIAVNDAPIKLDALKAFSAQFSCHHLAPCTTEETVKFTSDPSFNKELLAAIANFNIDQTDEAVGMIKAIFDRTDLKPAAQHKAQYNYGLILLAQGQCVEARELFKKAYLANSKSTLYLEAFNKAKEQCAVEERAGGSNTNSH